MSSLRNVQKKWKEVISGEARTHLVSFFNLIWTLIETALQLCPVAFKRNSTDLPRSVSEE